MPDHRTMPPALLLLCLMSIAWSPAQADSLPHSGFRTAIEQNARLADFDRYYNAFTQARAARDPAVLIADQIRRSQRAEAYYRRPVSWNEIRTLQQRLHVDAGQQWPIERVAAAVDYTHAHMRESGTSDAVEVKRKLQRDLAMERKAFHGQVAEIAEARERRMLLTKDNRSRTYDLTEDRPRPRSLQLKFLQDPSAGLRELQADLANADPRSRHGVLGRQEVEQLARSGRIRAIGVAGGQRIYTTNLGPRITVLPSRAFDSVAGSQQYTRAGRATLAAMGRTSSYYRYATDGLAIAGILVAPLILFEAYGHGHEAFALLLDPSTSATALPYIHLAIALGHTAEVTTLLWMTGSQFAVFGLESLTLFELAATEVFLPIAVVVQGVKFTLAFYEYSSGRIGWEQFRDRATGPALFVVFTTTGAVICSAVPVAGTLTCAVGGAIISVPVSWWDKNVRAAKREAFEKELFQIRINAIDKSLSIHTGRAGL